MKSLEEIAEIVCLSVDELALLRGNDSFDPMTTEASGDHKFDLHAEPGAVLEIISMDIRTALKAKELAHARELMVTLRQFLNDHPDAIPK